MGENRVDLEALIAGLRAGTATNEDVARSRGMRIVPKMKGGGEIWYDPDGTFVCVRPDYLNDMRRTIADIEKEGWEWSVIGMADKSGIATVWSRGYAPRVEAASPTVALLIAFALAQKAKGV